MSLASQRSALLVRKLNLLEDLHPATVTISGTDYTANASPPAYESVLTAGGEMPVRVRTFVIQTANLASRPEEGTLLTDDDSAEWRIREVSGGTSDACWRLRCHASTDRGR